MMFARFDEPNGGHHVMAPEESQRKFDHIVKVLLDATPGSPVALLLEWRNVTNLDELEQYLIKPDPPQGWFSEYQLENDPAERTYYISDDQFEDLLALESYFAWMREGRVHDMYTQSRSDFEMFVGAIFNQTGPIPLFKTTTYTNRLWQYYEDNYRTSFPDPNERYSREDLLDDGETTMSETEAYERLSYSERSTMRSCEVTAGEILAMRQKPRKQHPQPLKPMNATMDHRPATKAPTNHYQAMMQDLANDNSAWAEAEREELNRVSNITTRSDEEKALAIDRLYDTGVITSPHEQVYHITYIYKAKETHTCRMVIDKAHGELLRDVIDNPTSYYHDNFTYGDYDGDPMMRLMLPDPARRLKRTSTEGCPKHLTDVTSPLGQSRGLRR